MIKRIVKMEFEADKVEVFKFIFKQNKSKIIAQEGCYGLELYQDIHEYNVFFTYSKWKSQVHLDRYRKTELFKNIWKETKVFFCNKPIAWSVHEIL